MGVNDREDPKPKRRRGSTDNRSRLVSLQHPGREQGSADWGKASPDWIRAVTVAATHLGMIVPFPLSRDGGADCRALYDNGERTQLWFNGDADLDLELEAVFTFLESLQ